MNGARLWLNRPAWTERIECLVQLSGVHNDEPWVGYIRQPRLGELDLVTPETDGRMRSPTFSLTTEEAQKLMDNLWHLGLRPSEGTGSAGALAATQRHLEDLKTVAFHALKIPKNS